MKDGNFLRDKVSEPPFCEEIAYWADGIDLNDPKYKYKPERISVVKWLHYNDKHQLNIILQCLNDLETPMKLVIDTGACENILCVHQAKRLNVKLNTDDRTTFEGIGRGQALALGSVMLDVIVGELILPTKFYVLDGLDIDGIIGAEFLRKHTLYVGNNFEYIVLQTDAEKWTYDTLYSSNIDPAAFQIGKVLRVEQREQNKPEEVEEEGEVQSEFNLDSRMDCDLLAQKLLPQTRGRDRIVKLSQELDLAHLPDREFRQVKHIVEEFDDIFF